MGVELASDWQREPITSRVAVRTPFIQLWSPETLMYVAQVQNPLLLCPPVSCSVAQLVSCPVRPVRPGARKPANPHEGSLGDVLQPYPAYRERNKSRQCHPAATMTSLPRGRRGTRSGPVPRPMLGASRRSGFAFSPRTTEPPIVFLKSRGARLSRKL